MYVIATAGHVDHGKSTLVRALTGINPDRLREEQEREMTIDLGFAWMTLPDGESVGIVDVPGHIDFIENMLAGVGGIDLALLVIAADEGPMPQTREHLAILNLLRVPRAVVALTKLDMSPSPEWPELISADIRALLQGTPLADAPIVPVSARHGQGLTELVGVLQTTLAETQRLRASGGLARRDLRQPRLPVDRAFTIQGFGTVVTGTLIDGSFTVGDEVVVWPEGVPARIRGLQTHQQKLVTATPGSRVAINLSGVTVEQVARGSVIAPPLIPPRRGEIRGGTRGEAGGGGEEEKGRRGGVGGGLQPTELLDVQLEVLAAPYQRIGLKHNTEVKVFCGTAERIARVRLLNGNELAPGATGWAQLELAAPVAVANGDRFIARLPSPSITVGGGVVVDAHPSYAYRRHAGVADPGVLARLEAMLQGAPIERVEKALLQLGFTTRAECARQAGLNEADFSAALAELGAAGAAVQVDEVLAMREVWQAKLEQAAQLTTAFHKAQPLIMGMQRESLRNKIGLAPRVFNALVRYGAAAGALVDHGETMREPTHQIRFTQAQQQDVDNLLADFHARPLNAPSVKDSRAAVSDAVYEALLRQKRLVQVKPDVVFLAETYAAAVAQVREIIQRDGSVTAAQVRDALGTTRKYALGLLEHLDEIGVTRRVGDARVLR